MNLDLEGKVVLLTGASGGIGRAISHQFLASGCRVALISRDKNRLSRTADELRVLYGSQNVVDISADCTQEENLVDAVSKVIGLWSSIDIAIANVGDGRSDPSPIPGAESFLKSFETNFRSAEILARVSAEELRKSRGSLLFVASIAGLEMTGAPTDYSVAKAAVVMLSKQLSRKLSPEIRVNCIAPGNIFFEGGRWAELQTKDPVTIERMLQTSVPLQRFGSPEDVANAALFLCSPKARFITGACLTVDGGQTVAIH